jgi:hypothetical protein
MVLDGIYHPDFFLSAHVTVSGSSVTKLINLHRKGAVNKTQDGIITVCGLFDSQESCPSTWPLTVKGGGVHLSVIQSSAETNEATQIEILFEM